MNDLELQLDGEKAPAGRELPATITLRRRRPNGVDGLVTFDRDIVRRYAPAEYRAVVDAGARHPEVDIDAIIAMSKAQFERDQAALPEHERWEAKARREVVAVMELLEHQEARERADATEA
jgi:hypothetical protein